MKIVNISEEWNLGFKGHANFDFVDVVINDDNELFIDPCLIELYDNEIGQSMKRKISSYMNQLIEAYKTNNDTSKKYLLKCAKEPNATKLGYGNGYNGKGNTVDGLIKDFQPLEKLLDSISTINKIQDLSIFLPGFAEDGMSDLLTNILHKDLSEFTDEQMKKYGIESNGTISFLYWDDQKCAWSQTIKKGYLINGKEFMLVPKQIVRKKYLFSTGQYFMRIIVERMKDQYVDAEGKGLSKKDIMKSKRFSGEHWLYDETMEFTEENNDALEEYHDKWLLFYRENGGGMTDDELDKTIYCVQDTMSA